MENDHIELSTKIVAAYVGNNPVTPEHLNDLITSVYKTMVSLKEGATSTKKEPYVSVRSSIKDDYIICLHDGKHLKMLKRYLRSHYDQTPAEYRAMFNLPADYPMVAPNYAAVRSEFAKKNGLGKTNGTSKRKAKR